jgi:hypothetical protein
LLWFDLTCETWAVGVPCDGPFSDWLDVDDLNPWKDWVIDDSPNDDFRCSRDPERGTKDGSRVEDQGGEHERG